MKLFLAVVVVLSTITIVQCQLEPTAEQTQCATTAAQERISDFRMKCGPDFSAFCVQAGPVRVYVGDQSVARNISQCDSSTLACYELFSEIYGDCGYNDIQILNPCGPSVEQTQCATTAAQERISDFRMKCGPESSAFCVQAGFFRVYVGDPSVAKMISQCDSSTVACYELFSEIYGDCGYNDIQILNPCGPSVEHTQCATTAAQERISDVRTNCGPESSAFCVQSGFFRVYVGDPSVAKNISQCDSSTVACYGLFSEIYGDCGYNTIQTFCSTSTKVYAIPVIIAVAALLSMLF